MTVVKFLLKNNNLCIFISESKASLSVVPYIKNWGPERWGDISRTRVQIFWPTSCSVTAFPYDLFILHPFSFLTCPYRSWGPFPHIGKMVAHPEVQTLLRWVYFCMQRSFHTAYQPLMLLLHRQIHWNAVPKFVLTLRVHGVVYWSELMAHVQLWAVCYQWKPSGSPSLAQSFLSNAQAKPREKTLARYSLHWESRWKD